MKLDKSENIVEHNGLSDSGEFTIAANAHAFQILSSGVYTNKLRAPIRELCCNAFDAHAAVNDEYTPIEVRLPSKKNLTFSVKDYGPGLSDSDVENIYSTYFKSTRNTSNVYTGGFGIGSKSPFAVVDSFRVQSRFEGMQTDFEAFLDKERVPRIKMLDKQPTQERSGLTVSFEVPKKNLDDFLIQAVEVVNAFDGIYDVHHDEKLPLRFDLYNDRQGRTFGNTKWDTGRYRGEPIILMGNIAYPLSTYASKVELKDKPLLEWFLNKQVYIKVGVGEVNVAASREDLSYDRKTLKTLPEILKAELTAFAKGIYNEAFENAETRYAGALKLKKICHDYSINLSHEKIADELAELGEWQDDVKTLLTKGITSLFPDTVKFAVVNDFLDDIHHFLGHRHHREQYRDFAKRKSRPASKTFDINDTESLLDYLEESLRELGQHSGFDMDYMHDFMLPPPLLFALNEPLMPYDRRGYGNEGDVTIQPVPRWELLKDEDNEDSRNHHWGYGRRMRPPTDIDFDRDILRVVLNSIKPNDGDRFRNRHGITLIAYPDTSVSLEKFGEDITEFNNRWGTTISIDPALLTDTQYVPKIKQEPELKPIKGMEIWDLRNPLRAQHRRYLGGTDPVNLEELNEPFLYSTEDIYELQNILYHEDMTHVFEELGAPPKFIAISEKEEARLVERGISNGIKFRDFVTDRLYPWAVKNASSLTDVDDYHENATQSLYKICVKLQKHPEASAIQFLKDLDLSYMERPIEGPAATTINYLLRSFKLDIPKKPDPMKTIKENYPFLALPSVQKMEISQVVSYIKSIDLATDRRNKLNQSPGI